MVSSRWSTHRKGPPAEGLNGKGRVKWHRVKLLGCRLSEEGVLIETLYGQSPTSGKMGCLMGYLNSWLSVPTNELLGIVSPRGWVPITWLLDFKSTIIGIILLNIILYLLLFVWVYMQITSQNIFINLNSILKSWGLIFNTLNHGLIDFQPSSVVYKNTWWGACNNIIGWIRICSDSSMA